MTACENLGATDDTSADASSEQAPAPDSRITVRFISAGGQGDMEKKENGPVELVMQEKYRAGDTITVILPEGEHYLALSLCEKLKEAILYLPTGMFTYRIPEDMKNYFPSSMYNLKNTIRARIPSPEELAEERNLALNPYDVQTTAAVAYPHADSNNQYNRSEFGAHNVLDGVCKNTSHGNYPYQSWGAGETVKESDYLLIHFGREVLVSELVLYLRADFSSNHDAYFSSVTVEFSDGSSCKIAPERTAKGQSFALENVKTEFVRLTGFVTDKSRGTWAGFTEVEVYGTEVAAQP